MDKEGLQGGLAALNKDLATVVLGCASTRSRSEGAPVFKDKGSNQRYSRKVLAGFFHYCC